MPTSSIPPQPTEGQVYAAYQTLLETLNAQCEATTDPTASLALNNAAQTVSDALSADNEIALQASTSAFTALTPGMEKANGALKTLKDQMAAIATKINDAGKVLGAINEVLQLAGKFL